MTFSLITGIIVARVLGAEGRGGYVLATSFAGMFLLGFVNMGFELAASVMVAKSPKKSASYHGVLMTAALAMLGLMLVLIATVGNDLGKFLFPLLPPDQFFLILMALPFWSYLYGCYGILVGQGRVRERAFFDLGLSLLQNGLVIALLIASTAMALGPRIAILVYTFFTMIIIASIILPMSYLRDHLPKRIPSRQDFHRFFGYGLWVYIGNMGGNLGQKIDQFFLQRITVDPAAFGIYTLATSLTQRTRIFPQALSRSSYSRICQLEEPESARLVASTFRQMLVLGILMLAGGALLSPLIPLIYTSDFAPAVMPFIIFLGGRLFHNCSWMLANYFSGTLGNARLPAIVNWGLLPIQAVLAWWAVSYGGLIAVATVTSLTYLVLFLVFLLLYLRLNSTVGLKGLFLIGAEDLRPWLRLFNLIKK